ncbi:hypothetical protein ABZP36_016673 [Zizania latifolia]
MDLSSPAAAQVVTARASLLCYSTSVAASTQHSREFEFHMSAPVDKWEPMASPADELFYKGKLLPLHLPPRIQMFEKLLESAADKGLLSVSTAPATPYQSCNVSPANSCYVSGELNAEHYFHECTSAGIAAEEEAACEKKSWSKKLKFIRHLNLGLKLKASKAYLKTIFAAKAGNPDHKTGTPSANELSNAQFKTWRKNPFGHIKSNSVGPVLRRSSSASSEMDNPIQGAIAYCKKSQQLASVRKSASDTGFWFMSSSASRIAAESKDSDDNMI